MHTKKVFYKAVEDELRALLVCPPAVLLTAEGLPGADDLPSPLTAQPKINDPRAQRILSA